jgi:hypothetical protein
LLRKLLKEKEVKLMKKIISLILIVVVIFGLFSCTDEKVLTTPSNISLSEEGLITWDPVSNATSYVPIGYWYLVIATDTGKKFEDTILIYNKNEYYVLSEDIFNFNYTL